VVYEFVFFFGLRLERVQIKAHPRENPAGFAVTSGMGLYQLAYDASAAAVDLDNQLKMLREETHHTQKNLRAKIAMLETDLAKRKP